MLVGHTFRLTRQCARFSSRSGQEDRAVGCCRDEIALADRRNADRDTLCEVVNALSAKRVITAAEGFFALGMFQDAWDELALLAPEQVSGLLVLRLKLAILNGMKRHQEAAEIGASLIANGQADGDVYLATAWAIRRAHGLEKAEELLLSAESLLSDQAIFHYNLACYAAVLGRLAEARERLARAFAIDPAYRRLAPEDPDLESLRPSM
jgi:tetratricopeptide (TPR) repeat protein